MKPREPRVKCVIKARMRVDGGWTDVCIRNISSRGMLLQAGSPPRRGTYLEIYRGRHVAVARVAWTKDRSFGIHTQDRLDVQAIINEPDLSSASYNEIKKTEPTYERRSSPRSDQVIKWRAEQSRLLGKTAEFACIAALGLAGAMFLYEAVAGTLSEAAAEVSAHLSP